MHKNLLNGVEDCIRAAKKLGEKDALAFMEGVSDLLSTTFLNKKKIILAGNGGSLCDASHFAEELTGFFRAKRAALPAIALSDPGHMSCVGNDIGFDYIFSRGVEALGQEGDVFIGLTTSGNSENIYKAFLQAKAMGLKTVAFLGKEGGKVKGLADFEWIVSGFQTSDRVQEAHMAAIHLIIELIEDKLFTNNLQYGKINFKNPYCNV